MINLPLPQNPIQESFSWREWFKNIFDKTAVVFGQFYSTTNQTAAAIDTVYTMKLDSTVSVNEAGLNSSNGIVVSRTGVYNLSFSCQFANKSTSAIGEVALWPAINGVDVPWSATSVSVPVKHSGVEGYTTVTANFYLSLTPKDVVTMRWVTNSTSCYVFVNSTTPPFTAPLIPGLVVSIERISP